MTKLMHHNNVLLIFKNRCLPVSFLFFDGTGVSILFGKFRFRVKGFGGFGMENNVGMARGIRRL